MTYKQFLKELAPFKGKFRFDNGCIRNKVFSNGYCPIAAIHVGKGWINSIYSTNKRMYSFAANVIDAADNINLTPKKQKIRKDLLRVLGLKEK